ncbi:MAG: HEAT repeat domain-containing protein [Deltaproteobacteria bacterium]|nr:HEAT repeat domain-containing protein [Deltaproteobacteria bacterium]
MRRSRLFGLAGLAVLAFWGAEGCKKKDQEQPTGAATAPDSGEPGATTEPAAQPTTPAADAEPTEPAQPTEPEKPALAEVTLKTAPTAEEQQAAQELAAKLADLAQREAELGKPEQARLFLVLAASGKTEPPTIGAALLGLAYSWKEDAEAAFLEDYRAVVAARLGATEPEVLGPALKAAKKAVASTDPIDPALVQALLALVARPDDPAAPYEALDVLGSGKKVLEAAGTKDAFLAAFGSTHPHVAATALTTFAWLASGTIPDAEAYRAKIEELLKHADPAVRGEACGALAEFVPFGDAEAAVPIAKLLLPLLDDENPFVRSRAASSLADIKYKPAIHAFVKHLDDPAPNTYDTPSWKTLEGNDGWDHHDGSAWSRVDDAMLRAIQSITFFDDVKFEYQVNVGSVEADLAAAVEAAKAWYEAHKADIPPLE